MRVTKLFLSVLVIGLLASTAPAFAQPAAEERDGAQTEQREDRRPGRGPEGRELRRGDGPFQGPGRFQRGGVGVRPGQILPPMLVQRLGLSPEQIEQLEALQKDVNTRLDGILTEQQRTQLRELAERGPRRPGGEGVREGRRDRGDDGEAGRDRGPRRERGERGERERGPRDRGPRERDRDGGDDQGQRLRLRPDAN